MSKAKSLELRVDPAVQEVELAVFKRTLKKQGQLHEGKGLLPSGATHQLVENKTGAKAIVRKRFSAF